MNLCSLFCRPLVGNLADRLSKYKVSTAGAALMSLACLGYILSSHPAGIVFFRVVNGVGFALSLIHISVYRNTAQYAAEHHIEQRQETAALLHGGSSSNVQELRGHFSTERIP